MQLRASSIASLPPSKRQAFLASLTQAELEALEHDWHFWARDDQLPPPGDWRIWLAIAGRGWGKTRVGAEWAHERAMAGVSRGAIIAATMDDARKVCIDGDSGILATAKPWFRPKFEPAKNGGTVTWPNGAIAELYSGEKPAGLRGPQFHWAWCDEFAKWRRLQDAWDMLRFALRLGSDPRTLITTTPTPAKLIKQLMREASAEGRVRLTRGSTYANAANLAEHFLQELRDKYEGTRLGRQELFGEVLEDKPGALWTLGLIEEFRTTEVPALERIVVAIDPPVTSGEDADECGIIGAGRAGGHAYVLADASERGLSPKQWAEKALGLYVHLEADCIVAEANNGGEMITQVIRSLDANVLVKLVWASRGKYIRAEPVSGLYAQGRVHHQGVFKVLEDQMCLASGTLIETARGHIAIERVVAGDQVMTRAGYRSVEIARETGCSSEFVVIETTDGRTLRCTPTHPIFDASSGQFVPAKSVEPGMRLDARPSPASMVRRSLGAVAGTTGCRAVTTATRRASCFIGRFGRHIADLFREAVTSTIATRTLATISSAISSCSPLRSTMPSTVHAASASWGMSGAASAPSRIGRPERGSRSRACTAGSAAPRRTRAGGSSAIAPASGATSPNSLSPSDTAPSAARPSERGIRAASIAVQRVTTLRTSSESVFNLKVEGLPEFYANGILTHNCDFTPDYDRTKNASPDRVDALVWAITEMLTPKGGEPRITRI